MNNHAIADNFSLLSKLMDIHDDNSFKSKSYAVAAFTIEKLPMQLAELDASQIFSLKGIGDTIGKKIMEQIETGQLTALNEYILKTPPGVIEMLNIKGIGPKKISTIWKEMEIETIGELLYACNENRLTRFKGFGEKTQQSVRESIEFYFGALGSYLFQQMEKYFWLMDETLKKQFSTTNFLITGEYRRQLEVIEKLEWVTTTSINLLKDFFTANEYEVVNETENYISFKGKENVTVGFFISAKEHIYSTLFQTSCSEIFLAEWNKKIKWDISKSYLTEEEIFETASINFIPAFQREKASIIDAALEHSLKQVIQPNNIKGIIHSHSTWSDGMNTLDEMAKAAMDRGLEYLVISDHSKTAAYAQGLQIDRVLAQHAQIDEINLQLAPFKIFKSIESDILGDGSLDYENEILQKFDLVIASIHSNLKMTEEKAMMRLLNAIENPFTSILGHMTGRLLLSRNGYAVDHKKIIEACAANHVVIELNAHPRRLDIDWRWIDYALEKNVLISINPDAHSIEGFDDCRYGILVAQKAGLTKEKNLSSFSLTEFEKFVTVQQQKRK
jgi:DNA polymerase (family 10)